MLDGMSDSIQRSRIEKLHSREVDRQSPTGLIFYFRVLVRFLAKTEFWVLVLFVFVEFEFFPISIYNHIY